MQVTGIWPNSGRSGPSSLSSRRCPDKGPAPEDDPAAEAGDQDGIRSNLEKLRTRHRETCLALLPECRRPRLARLESVLADFERIANGICLLGEAPPRSVDEAVATGERLSTVLVAARWNVTARRPSPSTRQI